MREGLSVASLFVAVGAAMSVVGAVVAALAARLLAAGGAVEVGAPGREVALVPGTAGGQLFVLGVVAVGLGLLSVAAGAVVAARSSSPPE